MIQNKINELKPYFRGIKLTDNYNIVEVNLKKSWLIPKDEDILVQSKDIKEQGGITYNMFYSQTKTIDDIIEFIQDEVINYNIELEQKEELLRMKVEELKMVFENKSLDELNNLKFTTDSNSLKLTGVKINETNKITQEEETKHGVTEELPTNS
jgi:hypothetical protein